MSDSFSTRKETSHGPYDRDDWEGSVTSTEFVRNFGYWQGLSMRGPVAITHHGKPRSVLVSPEFLQQLSETPDVGGGGGGFPAVALDHMQERFLAVDADWKIVIVNHALEQFLGKSRESMIGKRFFDVFPDLEKAYSGRRIAEAKARRTTIEFEAASVLTPGRILAYCILPFGDGAAILSRDITEQSQLRDGLAERQAMLAAFGAHGQVGTAQLNVRGRFNQASAELSSMLGLRSDALVGTRLVELCPTEERARVRDCLEAVLTGVDATSVDTVMLRGGIENYAVRMALSPMRSRLVTDGVAVVITPQTGDAA